MTSELAKLPRLSNGQIFRLVLMGLALSALFRTEEMHRIPFYAASVVALATMASVMVLPRRLLIYPVVILIAAMPDITQSEEEVEAFGRILSATPWQFSILSLSPAVGVLGSVAIAMIRLFKLSRSNPYNLVFFYFLGVATIVSVAFGYAMESPSRALSDARIPLFFCSGIVLGASYYRRFPDALLTTCQAFLAIAAGTFILDARMLAVDPPEVLEIIGYRNLSLDSGKGLLLLFVFFAIARLAEGRRILLNLLLMSVMLYVLVAFQTRQLIVTGLLGLLLVAPLLGLRRVMAAYVPVTVFLLMATPILIQLMPDVWEIMMLRFGFVRDPQSFAQIEMGRTGSIINSMMLLREKWALLTGLGYGSWYTDSYFPMPNLTVSAFDRDSLETGRFYRVPELFFNLLFKFGLIGACLYVAVFLRPLRDMWKARRTLLRNPTLRTVAIVLFGIFPTALTFMWWTGKGLLFCGIFVAVCVEWAKLFTREAAATPVRTAAIRRPAVSELVR